MFNQRKQAQERMQEMIEVLEQNKDKLNEMQNMMAEILESQEEGSQQIFLTAVIVATLVNGFDTDAAKQKTLDLAKEIIKTQK